MRKLILFIVSAGFFTLSSVSAQTKDPAMGGSKFGVGVDFAFPTGDLGDFTDFGFGGSLQYQVPIIEKLNFTASAGYLNFKGKDVTIAGVTFDGRNSGAIPVKAGIRYFLAENFYAGGELGAAFNTDGGGTAFVYDPQIGVEFPVSGSGSIDFSARYESWSRGNDNVVENNPYKVSSRFIGLRLAYNFGL